MRSDSLGCLNKTPHNNGTQQQTIGHIYYSGNTIYILTNQKNYNCQSMGWFLQQENFKMSLNKYLYKTHLILKTYLYLGKLQVTQNLPKRF